MSLVGRTTNSHWLHWCYYCTVLVLVLFCWLTALDRGLTSLVVAQLVLAQQSLHCTALLVTVGCRLLLACYCWLVTVGLLLGYCLGCS